ncbi:hypothetical protein EVAR_12241_1 [Eumeta japonica]|uniref:Uncharacterized protein n=1 Tax=Eumeta variegata TaxID=151549 RepID=A0A4C1TUE1_EUMVA|nr:hypothetical protein EVAR_12241_1 [Eumeta japonica]
MAYARCRGVIESVSVLAGVSYSAAGDGHSAPRALASARAATPGHGHRFSRFKYPHLIYDTDDRLKNIDKFLDYRSCSAECWSARLPIQRSREVLYGTHKED